MQFQPKAPPHDSDCIEIVLDTDASKHEPDLLARFYDSRGCSICIFPGGSREVQSQDGTVAIFITKNSEPYDSECWDLILRPPTHDNHHILISTLERLADEHAEQYPLSERRRLTEQEQRYLIDPSKNQPPANVVFTIPAEKLRQLPIERAQVTRSYKFFTIKQSHQTGEQPSQLPPTCAALIHAYQSLAMMSNQPSMTVNRDPRVCLTFDPFKTTSMQLPPSDNQ